MGFYQYPPIIQRQVDAMPKLRGSAYVRVYKAIMACDSATIALLNDRKKFAESTGKFTITNLIYLAAKYQVSVKFLCEWMNEGTHLHREYPLFPSGLYEKLFKESRRDFKIPDLLREARLEIENETTDH